MTRQDNAHPFDRRVFLAGSSALALIGAGSPALAQSEWRQGRRLGQAAAADAGRIRRRLRSQAGAGNGDRARPRRLHRHHRRFGRRQPRGGVAHRRRDGEGGGLGAAMHDRRAVAARLAAACGARQWRRQPCDGLRLHLHERAGGGAGDPGAAAGRRERRARRRPTCWARSSSAARSRRGIIRSSPRLANGGGWHTTGIVGIDRGGGRLRQADEAAGSIRSPMPSASACRWLAAAGQLRHHDQAAALRQRRAQRRAGGAAGEQALHRRMPRRSRATTASTARFGRALPTRLRPVQRSRPAARISSSSATASRTIRAAGAATPRSRRR